MNIPHLNATSVIKLPLPSSKTLNDEDLTAHYKRCYVTEVCTILHVFSASVPQGLLSGDVNNMATSNGSKVTQHSRKFLRLGHLGHKLRMLAFKVFQFHDGDREIKARGKSKSKYCRYDEDICHKNILPWKVKRLYFLR